MCRVGIACGLLAAAAVGTVCRAPGQAIAVAASASDGGPADHWTAIKNDGYEQRAHFAAGVERLSARLDREISLLKAKRAGMTKDTDDWDFAMKEVNDSRSYLTSSMRELAKATTPETWNAAKDKVGDAWKRAQAAVDKMNGTITS